MKLPKNVSIAIEDLEAYDEEFDVTDEENVADIVSDWLSDNFGFCHYGFHIKKIDTEAGIVKVTGIRWDTSE